MAVLSVEHLAVARGRSVIVEDISLTAASGKVTLLLGPNGAGKSTLMAAISGILPAMAGRIVLDGVDVTTASRYERARRGLAHVEQGRTVFGQLSVRDNIRVVNRDAGVLSEALELFPELADRLEVRAGLLSGGEQQMLVLARALACRPKVLMIDEMSLGLAPVIVRRLLPVVGTLAESGRAVVLVEQFAHLALPIAHEVSVLTAGRMTYTGPAETLRADPTALRAAYLGTDEELPGNSGRQGGQERHQASERAL